MTPIIMISSINNISHELVRYASEIIGISKELIEKDIYYIDDNFNNKVFKDDLNCKIHSAYSNSKSTEFDETIVIIADLEDGSFNAVERVIEDMDREEIPFHNIILIPLATIVVITNILYRRNKKKKIGISDIELAMQYFDEINRPVIISSNKG